MQFWKVWNKSKQLDYYSSIDELPVKIWFDIHKTGNFSLLLKNDIKIKEKEFINLSEAWNKIYNQYMKKFGLSEEFIADLNQSIRLAELQAKFIITKKPHYKTLIKVEKEKIKNTKEEIKKPHELESILATISKHFGFQLRSRDLTTLEYYSYINNITNG